MRTRRSQLGPIYAIVPVNILQKSKARLAPILTPAERRQLTVSMLMDVLSVLKKVQRIQSITLVSADNRARRIATRFTAAFLWEGKKRGLNKGVKLAIKKAGREGASAVLVVHADLPLLKPLEIETFLAESNSHSVALAPSKDGGTNALLLRPPDVIKPIFGKNSFRRHVALAKLENAAYKVLRIGGISFDVDDPRDLKQLMRRPMRNRTGRFLRSLSKSERHSASRHTSRHSRMGREAKFR